MPSNLVPLPRLRRFVRLAEVTRITGLCASTIYEKMAAGEFPRQVRLFSDNVKRRTVAWLEDEVIAWQQARIAARDAEPLPPRYVRRIRKAEVMGERGSP